MNDKKVNQYIREVWRKFNKLTDEQIKKSLKPKK